MGFQKTLNPQCHIDNPNNIEKITFEHRQNVPYNAFGYDHLDRLVEAEYLVGVLSEGEVFGMDDLGNRTTVNLRSGANQVYATDTPNITNRYTAVDGQPLDYDAAGNLTQDPDGYRYVYDYENRITRIYKLNGQTEIDVAQYAYDALGRRIEARSFADGQVDAVRRYWYNDQWQVLTQGLWSQAYMGLSLSRNYIYGNYIDEALGFEWVVDGTPSARYYYLHDHLYSPAAMLTDYGVVERYEYDAYGRRSVMTPGFAHRNNSHYLSDLGLTGREIDDLDLDATATPRLQHMHYRHRDYNPQLGRFMQHDPLDLLFLLFRSHKSSLINELFHNIILKSNIANIFEVVAKTGKNGSSGFESMVYRYNTNRNFIVDMFLWHEIRGIVGNLYGYIQGNPIQNMDPYGLIELDDLIEWNDQISYTETQCNAYCVARALGLDKAAGKELLDSAIDKAVDQLTNQLYGKAKKCGKASMLGICYTNCLGGKNSAWDNTDPWGPDVGVDKHGLLLLLIIISFIPIRMLWLSHSSCLLGRN